MLNEINLVYPVVFAILNMIHQAPDNVDAESAVFSLFGQVFKVRLDVGGAVKRFAGIANSYDEPIGSNNNSDDYRVPGMSLVGMFDDVGAGLVGR